jgi:glutathione S-transferase
LSIAIIFAAVLVIAGAWFFESRRRVRHPVKPGLNEAVTLPHTQEFELYHNALSFCSMKTRVCLTELNIDYRSHPVDLIETGCYETIRPAFLRINPAGSVPVLVHNGHPVYESHVQILYAAAHAPAGAPALTPTDTKQLTAMQYWIDQSSIQGGDPFRDGPNTAGNAIPGLTVPLFSSMVKEIPLWKIAEGLLFHFDRRRPFLFITMKLLGLSKLDSLKPVLKFHRASRLQMQNHLDAMEKQLVSSGGPWILGSQFSLADVSWMVVFERLEQADSLPVFLGGDLRTACAQYWQLLKARPSYQHAILDQRHPTVARGTARLKREKQLNSRLKDALDGIPSGT